MAQQRRSFRGTFDQLLLEALARPALPPASATANVYESADADEFVVEIAVPGAYEDEISVEATADSLTVSIQPKQAQTESRRRYLRREQAATPMARVIDFPVEIDPDHIQATLERGILTIHVPRAAAARRRVIKVKGVH